MVDGYEYDTMQFAFEYDNSSIYNLLFKYTSDTLILTDHCNCQRIKETFLFHRLILFSPNVLKTHKIINSVKITD